ncbi:hypothetical protein M231_05603 [Tremella mesenterica]|uniref:RNase III domain-containing protein n=1 Tax=Tremella mesenterica TaxID=5217 RepID=A0A4Q1BHQ7_TREME|nr:hypothetical protein M231_05603 [Tremella mesenterica]
MSLSIIVSHDTFDTYIASLTKDQLPPLPVINSKNISTIVFTHRGYTAEHPDAKHYEKYAHVGDAILGLAVTLMLDKMFPQQPKGPATTLKARLVNQDTLASISRLYGLLSSVRTATAAYEAVTQSSKNAAEIFEAYIGGLFHDQLERANVTNANAAVLTQGPAFDKITEWLEPIFRPMAERGYDPADADEEEEDRLAVGAISELFETLQRWGARPSFSETLETPPGANPLHGGMWRITCTVQIKGKSWSASAVRAKKQDAKAVATWKVLQHSRGDLQPRDFW